MISPKPPAPEGERSRHSSLLEHLFADCGRYRLVSLPLFFALSLLILPVLDDLSSAGPPPPKSKTELVKISGTYKTEYRPGRGATVLNFVVNTDGKHRFGCSSRRAGRCLHRHYEGRPISVYVSREDKSFSYAVDDEQQRPLRRFEEEIKEELQRIEFMKGNKIALTYLLGTAAFLVALSIVSRPYRKQL